MISSEIANAQGFRASKFGARKLRTQKCNPAPLDPKDGVSLSGSGFEAERNSGTGAQIKTANPVLTVMTPLGDEKEHSIVNVGANAEVKPKQSVTRYANPPAVMIGGEAWLIGG